MVPSWADQLLLQLLMEQFDTLPIQCRHIEHMHEGVGFRKNNFWQNNSYENLDNFSLIRLLNMHRWCLLNLTVQGFSLNLTVRGVSNKHCLLTYRPCVRPSVRPSVTFCFFNNLKSHCWIFIKPCKHVHICKTNTLYKKVRARGQFY